MTPDEIAQLVRPMLADGLIAFDVDGVLAPIVDHPDQSALSPGVDELLRQLSDRTSVAILSGRSLANLEMLFGFPAELNVIGSHGLEVRGAEPLTLEPAELDCLTRLELLANDAVHAAGAGAWLEHKPSSVVVHVRSADPVAARRATSALLESAAKVDGARVRPGHAVVELLARPSSKGDALLTLATELARHPIVFFGDDVTDEEAFAVMGPDDVTVRVGPGDTIARYRLGGPEHVVGLLRLL